MSSLFFVGVGGESKYLEGKSDRSPGAAGCQILSPANNHIANWRELDESVKEDADSCCMSSVLTSMILCHSVGDGRDRSYDIIWPRR